MKREQFKYIKNSIVKSGQPADIYYYTDVDKWHCEDFLYEFDWLVNNNVSKINIHINSCGGSVVDCMSVFSKILDCKIPTACINDGLAASAGSIIWAAGDEVYMKDYALLMIHNPFNEGDDGGKEYNQVTDAFKKQIKTIYSKRFGLSDDEIETIMNGEEGNDGTFFTADEAVEKGFVAADHIIATPAASKNRVNDAIKDGFDVKKLVSVMNSIAPLPSNDKKDNKNIQQHLIKNQMNENEITVFAALLGLTGKNATMETVSAQINEVKSKADKYDALKTAHDKLVKDMGVMKTELEGNKASVKNLTDSLNKANEALNAYKRAEEDAKQANIEQLVEGAINACKIDKADKETWVNLAKNDFDLAKKTIDAIPGREIISKSIANDEKNEKDAQNNLKSEEKKMQEAVDKVIPQGFQFKHFDE